MSYLSRRIPDHEDLALHNSSGGGHQQRLRQHSTAGMGKQACAPRKYVTPTMQEHSRKKMLAQIVRNLRDSLHASQHSLLRIEESIV